MPIRQPTSNYVATWEIGTSSEYVLQVLLWPRGLVGVGIVVFEADSNRLLTWPLGTSSMAVLDKGLARLCI